MRWWTMTRDEVRRLAREHVERQGLPWQEPVKVSRRPLGGWLVVTAADRVGGNVFMEVTRGGRVKGGTGVTPR
jgi:hypothetical protein